MGSILKYGYYPFIFLLRDQNLSLQKCKTAGSLLDARFTQSVGS
jgi:hypothetical protein